MTATASATPTTTPTPIPVLIRTSRTAAAIHRSTVMPDGRISMPACGAPGNTPAAYRNFRPVIVTDAAAPTCKRCAR